MNYKLGVNIDHIATLRNARNEGYPDVLNFALLAQKVGAHQITAHLREDRRHIKDEDMINIKNNITIPLNMEMALTEEMLNIATHLKPHIVCLVPEKREEITTEGGLNILANYNTIEKFIKHFHKYGIKVSLFVDAQDEQIKACTQLQPDAIEINTGNYANFKNEKQQREALLIEKYVKYAKLNNLEVHAGHGLNFSNIESIAKMKEITEFNIGHFLISYALLVGFAQSIQEMNNLIKKVRNDS